MMKTYAVLEQYGDNLRSHLKKRIFIVQPYIVTN